MTTPAISLSVNGRPRDAEVEPRELLVHFLRDQLGLTGTNVGCDTSSCGACTVLVDGASVKSCTMFAVQADGAEILTIEGLADGDELHPVQRAFRLDRQICPAPFRVNRTEKPAGSRHHTPLSFVPIQQLANSNPVAPRTFVLNRS